MLLFFQFPKQQLSLPEKHEKCNYKGVDRSI